MTLKPLVATTLPKSGTHLLERCLNAFSSIRRVEASFAPAAAGESGVPMGVGLPRAVSVESVRASLRMLRPGDFLSIHAPYSLPLASLLMEQNIPVIYLIRDPRDVALSLVPYVRRGRHRLARVLDGMSDGDAFRFAVLGGPGEGSDGLLPLKERFNSIVAWEAYRPSLRVKFEEIVGATGGGSDTLLAQTLELIADHIGLPASAAPSESERRSLFGVTRVDRLARRRSTHGFRQGQVEGWRTRLTAKQISLVDEHMGPELVEAGYPRE